MCNDGKPSTTRAIATCRGRPHLYVILIQWAWSDISMRKKSDLLFTYQIPMNKIMVNVLLSTVSGLILRPIHPTKNLKKTSNQSISNEQSISSMSINLVIEVQWKSSFAYREMSFSIFHKQCPHLDRDTCFNFGHNSDHLMKKILSKHFSQS